MIIQRPFIGNRLTSDPVRYARNMAVLEAGPALAVGSPTVAWTKSAFRAMRQLERVRFRQRVLAAFDAFVPGTPMFD